MLAFHQVIGYCHLALEMNFDSVVGKFQKSCC